MDTQKLRQRILDLAIRGKLLPQDPNDEPASVLLDRIRAEKERLIAEGKLKRPKAKKSTDKSHYQQFTPPFDIPESWEWVRLEDISYAVLGKMLDKSKNKGVNHPYLRNINVRWFEFDVSDLLEMPFEMQEADRYSIKHGDLVICEGGEPGRCAVWDKTEPIMFQKALHRVRFFGEINSHFISNIIYLYCLNGFITTFFTGSGIKHLTGESLANIPIPMPPIKEQQRILKSVNSFDIIIQQITDDKKLLSNTIILIKSKIIDLAMQGKLVPQDPADEPAADMLRRVNPKAKIITDNPHSWNIPNTWTWCQLGDIFQHNTGKALNSSNRDGIEYEYITTSNVYWNRFELDDLKKMPFKKNELEKCTVRHGDLLVCEGGDVGRAAIWNLDRNIMIQNHLHRLRPIANEIHIPLYYHVFRHYKDKDLIGGKGIALQGFSSKSLHQLAIPLPPYNEQKRIVAKIEELYSVLDQIEASLQS